MCVGFCLYVYQCTMYVLGIHRGQKVLESSGTS